MAGQSLFCFASLLSLGCDFNGGWEGASYKGIFQTGFGRGKGDPCEIERPGGASTNVGRRRATVSAVIGGRRGDYGRGLGSSAHIKRRRVHPPPPCCWSWRKRSGHLLLYNTSEPASDVVFCSFPL